MQYFVKQKIIEKTKHLRKNVVCFLRRENFASLKWSGDMFKKYAYMLVFLEGCKFFVLQKKYPQKYAHYENK